MTITTDSMGRPIVERQPKTDDERRLENQQWARALRMLPEASNSSPVIRELRESERLEAASDSDYSGHECDELDWSELNDRDNENVNIITGEIDNLDRKARPEDGLDYAFNKAMKEPIK